MVQNQSRAQRKILVLNVYINKSKTKKINALNIQLEIIREIYNIN